MAASPPNPNVDAVTSASDAEALTRLRSAHIDGFLPIVTPFLWRKWHELLECAGALQEFADVPKGIRFGWCLGIPDSFPLNCTYIPNNHKSALEHPDFIISYIHAEVAVGRYSGPFAPDRLEHIIGFFHTSPRASFQNLAPLNSVLFRIILFPVITTSFPL
jgi:hypothetical protein